MIDLNKYIKVCFRHENTYIINNIYNMRVAIIKQWGERSAFYPNYFYMLTEFGLSTVDFATAESAIEACNKKLISLGFQFIEPHRAKRLLLLV